jgi:hypothetical protein
MDRAEKKIHRITVGADPKTGISHYVGQVLHKTGVTITGIHEDLAYFNQFNQLRYVIAAKQEGSSKSIVWMHITHSNVILQYDLQKRN